MPFSFFDPTFLLLIPAMLLGMYAQFKVSSTFKKYSTVHNKEGITGAQAAKMLLESYGIYDVDVEHISGNLTDHYDPRAKKLRLSDAVYSSTSVAAVGIAAHETGHAVQHAKNYAPLGIRNAFLPTVTLGSNLWMPLFFIGILFASARGQLGEMLMLAGIILFSFVAIFQIITLPVEFNASSRAVKMLDEKNILSQSEITPVKKVLSAAALTYVAAVAMSISQLLRLLIIFSGRRDD